MKAKMIEAKVQTLRVCEETAPTCSSPENAFEMWQNHVTNASWFDEQKEALVVFALDTRHRCTAFFLVSLGTLNESLAHPREILRPLLVSGAYAFILAHNHPSGDPSPSEADRALTRRIRECAELLQVHMLDHVIAGRPNKNGAPYFSFKEHGLI